jgi:hypothetical protein
MNAIQPFEILPGPVLSLLPPGRAAGQVKSLSASQKLHAAGMDTSHAVTPTPEGLPPGRYSASVGAVDRPFRVEDGRMAKIGLPLASSQPASVQIQSATRE